MFTRITKRQAMARFADNKPVIFCPCKLYPSYPFAMHSTIYPAGWIEQAERYKGPPTLWLANAIKSAWSLAYNEWAYYNASYEAGYYAHYYIEGAL